MTSNIEMLNYIYQNAEMGLLTIPTLIKTTKDSEFKKILETQLKEYQKIFHTAADNITKRKKEAKELSGMAKLTSSWMTSYKTMTDSSISHLAEMIIQGSTKGMIEITKKINEFEDVDEEILMLAKSLLQTEESNIEQMKHYLG